MFYILSFVCKATCGAYSRYYWYVRMLGPRAQHCLVLLNKCTDLFCSLTTLALLRPHSGAYAYRNACTGWKALSIAVAATMQLDAPGFSILRRGGLSSNPLTRLFDTKHWDILLNRYHHELILSFFHSRQHLGPVLFETTDIRQQDSIFEYAHLRYRPCRCFFTYYYSCASN